VTGTATDNSEVVAVYYQLTNSLGVTSWQLANGTNSWTAGITQAPGTNIFRAFSMDAGGNYSPTYSLTMVYWLIAPLWVTTNGPGTVAPNYNNQKLILGKTYSMTATVTAGKGFVFTNWTQLATNAAGSNVWTLLTNGAVVTFTMQSNLVLQANFADTTKPTLTITNPAANTHFTNTAVTVKGTAADNAAVAAVYWRLGTNAWNLATGTNTWSALVNPTAAGTNVFSAYAADAAGNLSTTSTVSFVYVGSFAPVVVQTSGEGVVTPNYNGQSLGLNQTYVITAAGTNGFAFTSWTGGTNLPLALLTNGPALAFVMRSNLTLQANFADVQPPTIAITNPLPGGSLANLTATMGGTAADNYEVAAVMYQVNGGVWQTASGTNAWTATVNLSAGTNVFSAYSVDAAGNESATNTVGSFVSLLQPVIDSVIFNNGVVTVEFETVTGANYSLESQDTLNPGGGWTPLGGSVAGNGGQMSLTDTNPPAGGRFYRLVAQSP